LDKIGQCPKMSSKKEMIQTIHFRRFELGATSEHLVIN